MTTLRCLSSSGRQAFAIPLHSVARCSAADLGDWLWCVAGGMTMLDGRPVPISSLSAVLGMARSHGPAVVVAG